MGSSEVTVAWTGLVWKPVEKKSWRERESEEQLKFRESSWFVLILKPSFKPTEHTNTHSLVYMHTLWSVQSKDSGERIL